MALGLLWTAGILAMRSPHTRGIEKARRHELMGHIDDIGRAIGSPGAPITAPWYSGPHEFPSTKLHSHLVDYVKKNNPGA